MSLEFESSQFMNCSYTHNKLLLNTILLIWYYFATSDFLIIKQNVPFLPWLRSTLVFMCLPLPTSPTHCNHFPSIFIVPLIASSCTDLRASAACDTVVSSYSSPRSLDDSLSQLFKYQQSPGNLSETTFSPRVFSLPTLHSPSL